MENLSIGIGFAQQLYVFEQHDLRFSVKDSFVYHLSITFASESPSLRKRRRFSIDNPYKVFPMIFGTGFGIGTGPGLAFVPIIPVKIRQNRIVDVSLHSGM